MARTLRGGLDFAIDLRSLSKTIGSGLGVTQAVDDNAYMDAVIKNAYDVAKEAFHTEAAAAAASGTNIKHMFEQGTLGINRRKSNMRPNPNSERARLWEDVIVGEGKKHTLTYVFKPSLGFVPKPRRSDTNMDQEVIDQMSDHVFTWKARIMETGEMVNIAPKEAKFLLIPIMKNDMEARPTDRRRGYTISTGVTAQPGRGTQGNFTAYWTQFWEGRGGDIMNASVGTQIETDFIPVVPGGASGLQRPHRGTFEAAVAKESKIAKREAVIKAKKRRANGH